MSRLVEVFCATQRHQKTKKQKKRNADKGSHGFTPVTTAYILLRLRRALRHSIRIFLPEKITTISIYPSHAPITSPNLFGSRACATWLLPHRLGSVRIVRRWEYRPSRNLVRLLRYCQWSDHVWGFPSSSLLRYFVRCFFFSKECVTLATTG